MCSILILVEKLRSATSLKYEIYISIRKDRTAPQIDIHNGNLYIIYQQLFVRISKPAIKFGSDLTLKKKIQKQKQKQTVNVVTDKVSYTE